MILLYGDFGSPTITLNAMIASGQIQGLACLRKLRYGGIEQQSHTDGYDFKHSV